MLQKKTMTTKPDFFRLRIRLWGLITAAGVVAGAASILGFFGSFNWVLDLCAHFRVQYFFGLGGVALLLLVLRKPRSAAIFGVLAGVNLGMILPLYYMDKGGSTAYILCTTYGSYAYDRREKNENNVGFT